MSADRPYTSAGASYRPSYFGGFKFFPPVIKGLLVSNILAWVLFDLVLRPIVIGGTPVFHLLAGYLMLWPLGTHFYPWQILSYMFLHGGFLHLFFNMLVLWIFGTELEQLWGSRRFLLFYLACGVGAGLSNLFVAPLFGEVGPTVGASGAIFGLLIAFGMLFPDRPIYLYFLLPVKAKYFVAGYIGLELLLGITQTTDGLAHFAHLGGAAVGFLLVLKDLRSFRPAGPMWRSAAAEKGNGPDRRRPWREAGGEIREARFYDINTGRALGDRKEENPQEVIDAILDKISRGGYQSLTEEEKRILNEASRKIH
jgi:membrane associated rhomboid family serine protease